MNDQQNSDEPSPFNTKRFYEALLAYAETKFTSDDDQLPATVAFLLQDGSIKFSESAPLYVQLDILEESRLSDRLLVIVCVAYLEDQIRLLLRNFLAKDKETGKLLDPEKLPFLSAARLAFSSGLIAKDWLDILADMAALRNKFAHNPLAQSFDDLIKSNRKDTWKSIERLSGFYNQVARRQLDGTIYDNFSEVFRLIYTLLQFSIDHIATTKAVQIFASNEIIGISLIMGGFTKENIRTLIDTDLAGLQKGAPSWLVGHKQSSSAMSDATRNAVSAKWNSAYARFQWRCHSAGHDKNSNEQKEKTAWYRVSAWRQLAETANQYVRKGMQIMVVGECGARPYLDNAGQPAASLELTAR